MKILKCWCGKRFKEDAVDKDGKNAFQMHQMRHPDKLRNKRAKKKRRRRK